MTILFVDDEPSILSSLRRLFRPHGYRILLAESAAAGLEILRAEEVDLVVSDIRMPEMDGVSFLERVHARWPHVALILLTGYADINSAVGAVSKKEIFCYISKPWDDDAIVQTVRAAFEQPRPRKQGTPIPAALKVEEKPAAAPGSRQKWLLLGAPPVALLLSWISVIFLGWPTIPGAKEHDITMLLLYIFAIWGGLIALLFAISKLPLKTKKITP